MVTLVVGSIVGFDVDGVLTVVERLGPPDKLVVIEDLQVGCVVNLVDL